MKTHPVIIALLVITLLVFTTSPLTAEGVDWPQLGRTPQRSNYTPEPVGGYYTLGDWKNRWFHQFDSPVSQFATPVLAEGVVAIGTFDGVMHAFDHKSGKEIWTYQANGPLDHSAAIVDGKVYFTSSDWSLYCLDVKDGKKLWSYRTGRGLVVAPLVVNNRVYAGSKDGFFYCLDAKTGKLIWKTDLGEPVDCSASWSEKNKLVLTGTTNMNALALDPSGNIVWKRKIWGQSFRGTWPMVSDRYDLVIYRPLGSHVMWDLIRGPGTSFNSLFTKEEIEKSNISFNPWSKSKEGEQKYQDYAKENWSFDEFQDRVQTYLMENPSYRTFFTLDLKTGEDRYKKPVPVLYTWGVSQAMHSQAIDDEGGRAWAIWRGYEMLTENTSLPNLGLLDLEKGRFKQWDIPFQISTGDVQPGLHGGDEHTPITAASDTVFHGQNRGPGGWSMAKVFEHKKYPKGYHKSFKAMGWKYRRSKELAGKGPENDPELKPKFIRTDSQVIYSHGTLIFSIGGGITCWEKPQ